MDGEIYAHAFKPGLGLGGDVHIREDRKWNFDVLFGEQPSDNAASLFAVVLHELGHSIGLDHTNNRDAVMYYSYTSSTGVLSKDDIQGVQHIYGVPRGYFQQQTTVSMNITCETRK